MSNESKYDQRPIQGLRKKLDEVDEELIKIIALRIEIIQKMGLLKKENNINVLQFERWNEVLQNRLDIGEHYKINPEFLTAVFKIIHDESLRIQKGIINNE